ncbi:Uncharacterised protein [Achromobacter sp. 2789STDY5608633]|uniref:phage neck terminator protein n=1 Tax=Achromobacter sp. 2789STDY5608633 TaxID=1806501 RepID=UPI0006C4018F|nr:hypothetical protein [Achromobacter sp. 2789STDY5608633]CUJ46318.1 Uncharacterised protein [Achromobacter sp. 2789STDY5608633]
MAPEDAIFELIEAAAAGVPVIFANENGNRPRQPYIAMAVRWSQAGPAERGSVGEDGLLSVSHHTDAIVELQGYGAGAFEGLAGMQLRLQHPLFEDRAEALGLAVFDQGRLENVPVLRDGARYEQRAVLELGVRYATSFAGDTSFIATVAGAGVTSGGLTPPVETTFSVTEGDAP